MWLKTTQSTKTYGYWSTINSCNEKQRVKAHVVENNAIENDAIDIYALEDNAMVTNVE